MPLVHSVNLNAIMTIKLITIPEYLPNAIYITIEMSDQICVSLCLEIILTAQFKSEKFSWFSQMELDATKLMNL